MRWVSGEPLTLAAAAPTEPTTPSGKTDVIPTARFVADAAGHTVAVAFDVPEYDPAVSQTPAETRVYLIPEGESIPDAETLVGSLYPYSSVAPRPEPYETPLPARDESIGYAVQPIHGYLV